MSVCLSWLANRLRIKGFVQATQVLPYYGVPLGTFKYDKLGIHGEIYLADDHTIVIDKFVHNPHTSACKLLESASCAFQCLFRSIKLPKNHVCPL